MSNTQIIPTDKNGHVYYGPKSFAAACEMINQDDSPEAAPIIAKMLDDAGYKGIANRVRKYYGV